MSYFNLIKRCRLGVTDDTAARRIEARIKVKGLKVKFGEPKQMSAEDIK